MFLIQLLVILAQWASGAWPLPVLRNPPFSTPLGWVLFLPCVAAFIVGKKKLTMPCGSVGRVSTPPNVPALVVMRTSVAIALVPMKQSGT